jgi:hypothetical protein
MVELEMYQYSPVVVCGFRVKDGRTGDVPIFLQSVYTVLGLKMV